MIHFIFPKFRFRWEKWKWNKEYRIYVSSYGNFKDEYKRNIPIKINNGGYVAIRVNNQLKLAHRLVMLTFNPIPNAEDLTVDHLNHNKRDNSLYNLEWVSEKENKERANRDFVSMSNILSEMPSTGATLTFKTYEDGVNWALANIPSLVGMFYRAAPIEQAKMIKKVRNRIKNSMKQNKTYQTFYWQIENMGE